MEQRKILSGMMLTTAIASFFHILFIGQLKYPTKGEAVAIELQRKFAKVDEEGEQSYFIKKILCGVLSLSHLYQNQD
jgi:hypothetical protein